MRLDRVMKPLAAALAVLAVLAVPALANLTSTLRAGILAHYTGTNAVGSQAFDVPFSADVALASGTGSYQADQIYAAERTITASSSETLDLYGGLTDAFGNTLSLHKVKAILVIAAKGNTNNVVLGNAGSNPFLAGLGGTTPTYTVPPGGSILISAPAAGWTVTDSSNDNLKVANSSSGTSVTYDIVVLGTSA